MNDLKTAARRTVSGLVGLLRHDMRPALPPWAMRRIREICGELQAAIDADYGLTDRLGASFGPTAALDLASETQDSGRPPVAEAALGND